MKRKIAYIFTTAVISLTAFFIGKFTAETNTPEPETMETTVEAENAQEIKSIETTEHGMLITFGDDTGIFVDAESLEKVGLINVNDIKGWENWDNGNIAGIELQANNWIYEITKVPYTVETTATKTE